MQIVGKSAAEIFNSIRLLSDSGRLEPGQSLPPVRELAVTLGVNPNTVAAAYRRLVTAGIALTQGRLGTVIRGPEGIAEREGTSFDTSLVDVAGGNPSRRWLPDVVSALARADYCPRHYGDPTVSPELIAYAQRWFANDCPSTDAIELTGGAVDAIERLLAAHLVPGDAVALEDPCFISSVNALTTLRFQCVGVSMDHAGMCPQALDAALAEGARAVIITPRAHNPTGGSLSVTRAQQIRTVLARYPHVLVIVDDHFALLANDNFHSPFAPETQRWALIRSVSKALGPDLRVAFVACDARTASQLRLRLAPGASWVSHILQSIVASCLRDPECVTLIGRAREDYAQRRGWMMSALKQQGMTPLEPSDGLNVWLPIDGDSGAVVFALARRGWLVRGGDGFRIRSAQDGLRLTIADIDQAQASRLAQDIRRCLEGESR